VFKNIWHKWWDVEYIDDVYARSVQANLLKIILLTTCIIAFISASLALAGFLPFGHIYSLTLYIYTVANVIAYRLIDKDEKFYTRVVHILVYSSIVTFAIMVVDVTDDAFRFIWFFLLSFAAYIFGGRGYGIRVSILIYILVLLLYFSIELYLSIYVLITFVASFFAFNIFMTYFLLKINIDVETLQKRIDNEVQKRQSQEQLLLRQYRMQNMGEMIDAIAHQWRQPLMQSNMLLLNMEEELDNKIYLEQKMQELITLNTHMSQTIDDFRHLMHDNKNKVAFEVHKSIDEVLILMKQPLAKIDIQTNYAEDNRLIGYKNELIQVLITLLSNAIEALDIAQPKEKIISLATEVTDDTLTINIEDTAGGIPLKYQEKIFDSYFSTKTTSGGSGLGLYIAKLIVEDTLQGTLTLTHKEQGACFSIALKRVV